LKYDIAGSIAHAHALAHAGVISKQELKLIEAGLKEVADDIRTEKLALDPKLEDIHMNVEHALTKRIGEAGAKLHTGRSRNDQVALDMRLFVREALLDSVSAALELQQTIISQAKEAAGAILPGYTHVQHAQPILLAHHLLAHYWKLERDISRMFDCYSRTNLSPLGSGALAGVWHKIDRRSVADMLGLDGITENSIDSVSDRDFVAESAFSLSLLMIHLSSLCEELVYWSSREFGFLKLPKDLSGGSSMMPQKWNPDIPELVRGKSGRAVGDLVAILTLMKSLPLAYNRDLQEDKENLFDVFDTVEVSLHALTDFLQEIEFDRVRMRRAAETGLMTATDLADLLTTLGIPFRSAHGIVKDLATRADGDDKKFMLLAKDVLMKHKKELRTSDLNFLKVERAVERRSSEGGTSKGAVSKQMAKAVSVFEQNKAVLNRLSEQTSAVDKLLA
jgi:argininosuccinate lyase